MPFGRRAPSFLLWGVNDRFLRAPPPVVSLLEADALHEQPAPVTPTKATVDRRIERNRLRMQRNSIEQYALSTSSVQWNAHAQLIM